MFLFYTLLGLAWSPWISALIALVLPGRFPKSEKGGFSGGMTTDFEAIPLAYDDPEEAVKAGARLGRSRAVSVKGFT